MQIHKIKPGQRQQCLLAAGSSLFVQSGKLLIQTSPQFLEGVAWQVGTRLSAGMSYQVERYGWVELQALEASELVIQQTEPAGWRQTLSRVLHSVLTYAHRQPKPV